MVLGDFGVHQFSGDLNRYARHGRPILREHGLLHDHGQRGRFAELHRTATVWQRRDRGVHPGIVTAVPDSEWMRRPLGTRREAALLQTIRDELVKRVEQLFAVRVRPRRVPA